MAIRLTYRAQTSVPVEIEGFTPDWVFDKSTAEIERFEIFHGNCKIPLAEMFTVSGDPKDKRMDFEGNLSGVHWIGAHMASGVVSIHGPSGRHVGSQMRGGEIMVNGNAGGWVGAEMHNGLIHIKGNTACTPQQHLQILFASPQATTVVSSANTIFICETCYEDVR